MKITTPKTIQQEKIIALVCDKCHRTFDDPLEIQEFLLIDFIGGYSSIFGDGMEVKCDICQYCLHLMISDISTQNWKDN